jgi:hypothetical protein
VTICISKEDISKSKIDPGKSPSACRVMTRLKLEVYGSNWVALFLAKRCLTAVLNARLVVTWLTVFGSPVDTKRSASAQLQQCVRTTSEVPTPRRVCGSQGRR